MSMLAEPKRKIHIGPNPRGQFFIDEEDNRGKVLLRKMGWKKGSGLGLNRQGISEPIKPKVQMSMKGVGFKSNNDPWIQNCQEFTEILANIKPVIGGKICENENIKEKDLEYDKFKSLEEKSKSSKARIHYQKFVRSKDLSKITSKDWACIFGSDLNNKEKGEAKTVVTESIEDINSENLENELKEEPAKPCDINNNVVSDKKEKSSFVTINKGSMQDYFKEKMALKRKLLNLDKNENSEEDVIKSESVESIEDNEETEHHISKKFTKRKRKDVTESESTESIESEETENHLTKKLKKRKRKDVIESESAESIESEVTENHLLKKLKKRKRKEIIQENEKADHFATDKNNQTCSDSESNSNGQSSKELQNVEEEEGTTSSSSSVVKKTSSPDTKSIKPTRTLFYSRNKHTLTSVEISKIKNKFKGSNVTKIPGYGFAFTF